MKEKISPFLINTPSAVIYDSADDSVFYPIENSKQDEFTAIFVGNTVRRVKNFSSIQRICKLARIKLIVARNIPHDMLVHEYAKADVCINFSTFEGGPQTFSESALCGIPMLIRDNNPLSRKIPCFTGKTEHDFVEVLRSLKNDRGRCIKRGEEARNAVLESFTYAKTATKFANFFLMLARQDKLIYDNAIPLMSSFQCVFIPLMSALQCA